MTPQKSPQTIVESLKAGKTTDITVSGLELYFLPVTTRVPLKFGSETLSSVTCARVRMLVEDRSGRKAEGWGETPLSVPWVWPSALPHRARDLALRDFCEQLALAWSNLNGYGHPLELGHDFQLNVLPTLLAGFNRESPPEERVPFLAALVSCSPFDLALHDAFGNLHDRSLYECYTPELMNHDLAYYLEPAEGSEIDFQGQYPADYLVSDRPNELAVWHLVGGVDPLSVVELNGHHSPDGVPVLLEDWIRQDGLNCFKVKLRGNDAAWDYARLVEVGRVAGQHGQYTLSADFNCTVLEPEYVNSILDRLAEDHPDVFDAILYVEQPFPYDLEAHKIDVSSVSRRKPLLMDESAHNWQLVRLGRELGWTGVALKSCKTQTGAILTLCWAKAHRMSVMVQDLTNPMLAQIPHVLLGAHAGTLHGVESNAMQFYPQASLPEAEVHPGLYQRRDGKLDLSSIAGSGFGYRIDEIKRKLDPPAVQYGSFAKN
jgi:L-alanine-DL-glutamate epimerase-like enolase superfamily enzyme